jgi:hypothetical protein
MKIGNSLATFGLFAALTAGEALAGTPQITPAVMISGPGMRGPATAQDMEYRRRPHVVTMRGVTMLVRSKKKSAAIVAGSAAEARPSKRWLAVGKARESAATSPEGGPDYSTTKATRNKRR